MANEAADVGARVAKFLAEGAALPHYDNIPEQRNTLSAIPLIRRVRGFQAIVASLSPVEQKGALKVRHLQSCCRFVENEIYQSTCCS